MTKDEIIKELRGLVEAAQVAHEHDIQDDGTYLEKKMINARKAIKAALEMLEQPYCLGQQNGQGDEVFEDIKQGLEEAEQYKRGEIECPTLTVKTEPKSVYPPKESAE